MLQVRTHRGAMNALEEALNAVFSTRPTEVWLEVLEQGGFPAGPVLTIGQMHADPQTRAREMVVATDHPVAGRVETIGLPVKFGATPAACARPRRRSASTRPRCSRNTGSSWMRAGLSAPRTAPDESPPRMLYDPRRRSA